MLLLLLKDTLVGVELLKTLHRLFYWPYYKLHQSASQLARTPQLNTEESTMGCGRKLINGREKKRKRRPEK